MAVTTSQGPSAAVSSESATFNDLGQNPGNSRVYTVYAETSATIYNASIDATDGYDSPRRRFPPTFRGSIPLGQNWYTLGTLTLAAGDTSSGLTAAVSGSGGSYVTRIALVSRYAVDTYDPYSNLTQEVDALETALPSAIMPSTSLRSGPSPTSRSARPTTALATRSAPRTWRTGP